MATAAQLAANRANAQHSTGPRTQTGKAASSKNNLSHGLRAHDAVLPSENPAEYAELYDTLCAHFAPRDFTEERCVRDMGEAEWRLRRVRRQMDELIQSVYQELQEKHPEYAPESVEYYAMHRLYSPNEAIHTFERYEAKFERQYKRAFDGWLSYRTSCIRLQEKVAGPVELPPPTEQTKLPDEPNPPTPTPRNAPCPCGSGLKYKRCCGRNAPALVQLNHDRVVLQSRDRQGAVPQPAHCWTIDIHSQLKNHSDSSKLDC